MTQSSVTIHGVTAGITAEQIKQKLSNLYSRPPEKFEVVCRSLLDKNQPFVLIKEIEQSQADLHKKRLMGLGFICDEEEVFATDESGLSLAPVDAIEAADIDCPACNQPSGGGDICIQCEVIISKFLEHKKFDDQLQSQLKSSSYSQERMQEVRVEKSERESKNQLNKKLNKVAGNNKSDNLKSNSETDSPNSAAVEKQISVDADEKTSAKLYAVVASVFLSIVGTGFIAYKFVDNPFSKDEVLAKNEIEDSESSLGDLNSLVALDSVAVEPVEIVPETVFDFQILHQRELRKIEAKVERLYEEDMVFSIAHMISAKEDPREKIFGKQALIKLEEFDHLSIGELEGIHAMLGDLDRNFDRVSMLLVQASLYDQFELFEGAAELLEQASDIASDIEVSEDQIMAKVAFAEYYLLHSNVEEATVSYQQAKSQSSELNPQSLADSAEKYIAMSEASHGVSNKEPLSGELLTGTSIQEITVHTINDLSNNAAAANSPDLAAAQESTEIGDPLIDDLIKMTKQNQQKLKAVSDAFGQ